MYGLIIFLHVFVCALLVAIILMQSGRGGGLTEGFAAAESMFGAKTNVVLVRATTVLSTLFFITCLSLAFLSTKQSESLMSDVTTAQQEGADAVDKEASAPLADAAQKELKDTGQSKPELQSAPEESGPSQNP